MVRRLDLDLVALLARPLPPHLEGPRVDHPHASRPVAGPVRQAGLCELEELLGDLRQAQPRQRRVEEVILARLVDELGRRRGV